MVRKKYKIYTQEGIFFEENDLLTFSSAISCPYIAIPTSYLPAQSQSYVFITPDNIAIGGNPSGGDVVAVYVQADSALHFTRASFGKYQNGEEITVGGKNAKVFTGFSKKRFASAEDVPWKDYREVIRKVTFQNGETNVFSTDYWFYGFTNLETVEEFLPTVDTHAILYIYKSAKCMFDGCERLTNVGIVISNDSPCFNNTSSMFRYCSSLVELSLCALYTDTILDCSEMFSGDSNLETIGMTASSSQEVQFENATRSDNMFAGCVKLPNFDPEVVDNFNAADESQGGYLSYSECTTIENNI